MAAIDPTRLYREGVAHLQAGRLPEARAALETVVKAAPNAPEPRFQLGRVLTAQGDMAAAEVHLRKALKAKPSEPAIWQALHGALSGGARKKLEREAAKARITLGTEAEVQPILRLIPKDPQKAEAAALKLAKAAPAAPWPAFALGQARLAMGNGAGALGPLETAASRAPDVPAIAYAHGRALSLVGRVGRAEAVFEKLIEEFPQAALGLARIYRETARPEAAVELLTNHGDVPGAGAELDLSLAACGQGEEALARILSAPVKGADRVALFRTAASAAEEAGDTNGAEAMIDAALAEAKTAPLLTHRAQLRQSKGDMVEAERDLNEALALDPNFGEAYRAYANARKIEPGDPIEAPLAAALSRPDLGRADRRILHFAAAKIAADQKRHGDVFPHLETANRLMAEAFPYRFEADLTEARALKADWEVLKDISPDGPDDPVIFVTGLPRTGTTLVETILAAHGDVSAGGEMPFLTRALAPAMEALRDGRAKPDLFATAGARYLRSARRKAPGARVIADKAISTFSRIGHASRALPGAHFVLVRRDPPDVGLSLYRNMFPEGLHRYAYDLGAMGKYMALHDALIAFWLSVLPDRVHVVDYETLTATPEPTIRTLLDAVGLPFDPACLAPEASGRRIQTLSFAQARQPIGTGSVAGWKRHEAELQPLINAFERGVEL